MPDSACPAGMKIVRICRNLGEKIVRICRNSQKKIVRILRDWLYLRSFSSI